MTAYDFVYRDKMIHRERQAEAMGTLIGQRITALRHSRAMSLRTLEKETGISQETLHLIESGTREARLDEIMLIAWALGSTVGAILDENPIRDRVLVNTSADLTHDEVKAVRDRLISFLEMDAYLESHGIR